MWVAPHSTLWFHTRRCPRREAASFQVAPGHLFSSNLRALGTYLTYGHVWKFGQSRKPYGLSHFHAFSTYHWNFGVPFWDKWAAFLEPACCCIWFPQCDCFFGWAERRSGSLWQHPGNMISNKDLFHKMQDLHGFTSFQGQEHKENMRFQSLSQEILGVDTTHGPAMPCNAQLQGFDVRPCKAWRVGHTCAMTQVTHGHMICFWTKKLPSGNLT